MTEKKQFFLAPEKVFSSEWLYQAAMNIDQMPSATMIQLARLEGMIDEQNRIVKHPNLKD